jgi:hypothetical protein
MDDNFLLSVQQRQAFLPQPEFCSVVVTGPCIEIDKDFAAFDCMKKAVEAELLQHRDLLVFVRYPILLFFYRRLNVERVRQLGTGLMP